MSSKYCCKCDTFKDISAWPKHKNRPDGLGTQCKECIKNNSKNWYTRNAEDRKMQTTQYRKNNPWIRTYDSIQSRCTRKDNAKYYLYGGRGITNKISTIELKKLWFRDKAGRMKRPSIDRIDPDGHYEINNCRYIELSENSRRSRKDVKIKR